MKCFVLVLWHDYEGETFLGVFTSFENAVEGGRQAAGEYFDGTYEHLRVWECELDTLGEWCGKAFWRSEAFRTEVCHKSESGLHDYSATDADGSAVCKHCNKEEV